MEKIETYFDEYSGIEYASVEDYDRAIDKENELRAEYESRTESISLEKLDKMFPIYNQHGGDTDFIDKLLPEGIACYHIHTYENRFQGVFYSKDTNRFKEPPIEVLVHSKGYKINETYGLNEDGISVNCYTIWF